jgi:hypothetical protein
MAIPHAPVTFEQFFSAIVEPPVPDWDPQWCIQYCQTMHAGINYDFIGRRERVTGNVRVLAERIVPEFLAFPSRGTSPCDWRRA